MKTKPIFEKNYFYHVYNHGNGSEPIFRSDENYHYFMRKHREYLSRCWDIYAWSLLPGEFNLLIRIKDDFGKSFSPHEINSVIHTRFSHFANGYAQAFNKMYSRKGSVFRRSFRRIRIADTKELRECVTTIHGRPVTEKLANSLSEWKHSSFHNIACDPESQFAQKVVSCFGGLENFKRLSNDYCRL